MESVARELLGSPSQVTPHELRFGSRGSLSVCLIKAAWFDHETSAGGGVIDLVMRELRGDKLAALTWLRERGFIDAPAGQGNLNIVAAYPYHDERGTLLYEVCRLHPKSFRQRRPDPDRPGAWLWKMSGIRRVVYRLPEVTSAVREERTIFIVEGEKAADCLRNIGFAATCSPGGANKWRPEYAATFAGADVVVLPDHDEPGRQHAQMVARSLLGISGRPARVRILDLQDLPPKGDVADWIAAGRTAEQLAALVAEAPEAGAWIGGPDNVADVATPLATNATWEAPVDFFDDPAVTGTPALTADHLPDALGPFVADTSRRMGVEPATVALAALVSCASVMNEDWQIQPKQHDSTWTEGARLWGAIVGPPSILKTPVITACTKPVDRLDAEARKRHAAEMQRYKVAAAAWKKAGKEDGEPEPAPPKLERYLVEGTTVEALSEVLRDDAEARQCAPLGKVLVRQDEMSEWLSGFDRYRAGGRGGGDRGAYLRLYNGGRYTVDRIGRGSFSVPNWSACIIGGIQPEPIQRIAREAADDGLLQRFIYCVPGSQGGGEDRMPDHAASRRYEALFPALAALRPPQAYDEDDGRVLVVKLHAAAHGHRLGIERLIAAVSALPGQSTRLKAALGKWNGLFARLALTFHLIEIADARAREVQSPTLTILSKENAKRAAALMRDVLLPHLLRAEAVMFNTTQTNHARWIAGYILAKGEGRVTLRDIVRAYGPLRPPEAKRELMEVMDSLVSVCWLRPEDQANPARPPSAWHVNPAVYSVFAARAAAEKQRRAEERARLAEMFREAGASHA